MTSFELSIHLLELVVTVIVAVFASSGFWLYLERKRDKRGLSRRLLKGLAHDRIVYLSLKYIDRGLITQDEYENLCVYLYKPYSEMGGNGTVTRLMAEVNNLKIISRRNHILEKLKGEANVSKQ